MQSLVSHNMLPLTLSNAMQRNIGCDSIFVSATLHFADQFSEFYQDVTAKLWSYYRNLALAMHQYIDLPIF